MVISAPETTGSATTRCPDARCACADGRRRANAPNAVTLARTVLSLGLVGAAAATHSWPLLVAAYLAYWVGDVADGAVARATGQETRLGAVLDVLCDRVGTTTCALALLLFVPAPLPVAVFLVQFVVVDLALTLLTLRWPVLSPNHFHLVDPLVHRLNWTPPAKAVNTALLVLLLVAVPDQRPALAAAVGVLVLKAACLTRTVRRLRLAPERGGPGADHVSGPARAAAGS